MVFFLLFVSIHISDDEAHPAYIVYPFLHCNNWSCCYMDQKVIKLICDIADPSYVYRYSGEHKCIHLSRLQLYMCTKMDVYANIGLYSLTDSTCRRTLFRESITSAALYPISLINHDCYL